jgi:hypothetical protein
MKLYRLLALIVIVAAAGVIAWLALRDTSSSPSAGAPVSAVGATEADLEALAAEVGHPIFWAGPQSGYTYELIRNANGTILVRYLPPGVPVGSPDAYLTVATYPFAGAYQAVEVVSKQQGAQAITLSNGGIAEVSANNPKNVHAAYPGIDYQIEIFDPTPGAAKALVTAGRLAAFGSLEPPPPAPEQVALTVAGLKQRAKELGHPVYWVGPKAGFTYELTEAANGQIVIRYLPPGTSAGTAGEFLTVGTYPYPNALAAIRGLTTAGDVAKVELAGGGLAVVDKNSAKSIHIAFPGVDYQVEVFDSTAAAALQVVSRGLVAEIG